MAVNKVEYAGNTLIDLTEDTVTPQTLMLGVTAHNRAGDGIKGEFDPDIFQTKEDENLNTDEKNVVTVINGLNTNVAKLLNWYNNETYVPMVAKITPSNSTYELGKNVEIEFNWSFTIGTGENKENAKLSYLKFKNTEYTGDDLTKTSETVKNISSSGTYTVTGTRADGNNETVTANAYVYFYNKYYFGCSPKPEIPENATENEINAIYSDFIKGSNDYSGLKTQTGWADSRKTFTITPNCPDGSYIWYAYPAKWGISTFKMNGLPADFNVQVIEFTNSSGYKENYYLYRSIEHSLGSIEVQIS